MRKFKNISKILIGFIIIFQNHLIAQKPFDCTSQVWMLDALENRLVYLDINASNNAILITPFIDDLPVDLDAISFCSRDRLLYGIESSTKSIYSIDADGLIEFVATPDLSADLNFEAMGFSMDGLDLVCLGSRNGRSESIEIIRFSPPGYTVIKKAMPGGLDITDLAVNPLNGLFYGVNKLDRRIVSFNHISYQFFGLGIPFAGDDFQGTFCNAFGEIFAFGSTAQGVASALFKYNPNTLQTNTISTGPESLMKDFANCPYTIGLYCSVDPKFSFPCNEVEYTYRIANGTGRTLDDLKMESFLPAGFKFDELLSNPMNGDTEFKDEQFIIKDIELEPGVKEIVFSVELGSSLTAGDYFHQYTMSDLPASLASTVQSDNPITVKRNDATKIEIKVLDGDTIFHDFFFCITANKILDGSGYGTEYEWSDGSDQPTLQVDQTGVYMLEAKSGCAIVNVVFEVTIASCPYTIDLEHTIEPDSVYPCSTVEYNFIVNNDTGSDHINIEFKDTLPDGLKFLEILKNPFDGEIELEEPFSVLSISEMYIPQGIDTLICLVEVGDIMPGPYSGRAIISNFPDNLGSFRLSDNPETHEVDSTTLTVLGVESDSFFVEITLCKNETVILDGNPYGFEFEWFNGSTEAVIEVDELGLYELKIFTGCEVSFVFFEVVQGQDIRIEFPSTELIVHLGDSLFLSPTIVNLGDTLIFDWFDPLENSLSCPECLETWAKPLFNNEYILYVDNLVCDDQVILNVEVDNTRRIYSPNIISKSAIDENRFFYLQSPDFGEIQYLNIYDRYGNKIYSNPDSDFESNRWNGIFKSDFVASGVYIWQAEILFLDGLTEVISGSFLFSN